MRLQKIRKPKYILCLCIRCKLYGIRLIKYKIIVMRIQYYYSHIQTNPYYYNFLFFFFCFLMQNNKNISIYTTTDTFNQNYVAIFLLIILSCYILCYLMIKKWFIPTYNVRIYAMHFNIPILMLSIVWSMVSGLHLKLYFNAEKFNKSLCAL